MHVHTHTHTHTHAHHTPHHTHVQVAELDVPIRRLVTSGVRVVILAAVSSDVTHTFQSAARVGAHGLGFTWFGTDGTITADLYPAGSAARAAADGMLGIFPRFEPNSPTAERVRDMVMTFRTWQTELSLSGVTEPFNPWVRRSRHLPSDTQLKCDCGGVVPCE
jgi:hypothetical protein